VGRGVGRGRRKGRKKDLKDQRTGIGFVLSSREAPAFITRQAPETGVKGLPDNLFSKPLRNPLAKKSLTP